MIDDLFKYYQELSGQLNRIGSDENKFWSDLDELIVILYRGLYPYIIIENRFSYLVGRDTRRIGAVFRILLDISLLKEKYRHERKGDIILSLKRAISGLISVESVEIDGEVNKDSFYFYMVTLDEKYPNYFNVCRGQMKEYLKKGQNIEKMGVASFPLGVQELFIYIAKFRQIYLNVKNSDLPRCYFTEGHNYISHQLNCLDTKYFLCGIGHINRLVLDLSKLIIKSLMDSLIQNEDYWKRYVEIRDLETSVVGSIIINKDSGNNNAEAGSLNIDRKKVLCKYSKLIDDLIR